MDLWLRHLLQGHITMHVESAGIGGVRQSRSFLYPEVVPPNHMAAKIGPPDFKVYGLGFWAYNFKFTL